MESHIKDMSHQARSPLIGQKLLRLESNSLPSNSRNNQNSQVFPQNSVPQPSQSMNSNNSVDNSSVMINSASTTSNNCTQNSKERIKFNIKSKSIVRPHVVFQPYKNIDKRKNNVGDKNNVVDKQQGLVKKIYTSDSKAVKNVKTVVKEEPLQKNENTALFSNKPDIQIPQPSQLKSRSKWKNQRHILVL